MVATSTIVKYDNPILVSDDGKKSKGKNKKATIKQTTQSEDILNSILPPCQWEENKQLWVQYVSSTPATRLDVINLQEALDQKLAQRKARETGICPIREELYAQCFDELIRQVTVNCAERGLLLLRVRNEIRMTITAYKTLYESSVAFGMRKALQAEQHKAEMNQRIRILTREKAELQKNVKDLEEKCDNIEKREKERLIAEEKKHEEEVNNYKKKCNQFQSELERMNMPK